MDDQRHVQSEQDNENERMRRGARMFLILSPAAFVLCWILARVQSASNRDALIIAAAGFVMCLIFSLHWRLRGARSPNDMFWLNIIFNLFRR